MIKLPKNHGVKLLCPELTGLSCDVIISSLNHDRRDSRKTSTPSICISNADIQLDGNEKTSSYPRISISEMPSITQGTIEYELCKSVFGWIKQNYNVLSVHWNQNTHIKTLERTLVPYTAPIPKVKPKVIKRAAIDIIHSGKEAHTGLCLLFNPVSQKTIKIHNCQRKDYEAKGWSESLKNNLIY